MPAGVRVLTVELIDAVPIRSIGRMETMKARHPNLLDYPGRFVAIDDATDRVVADAAGLIELWDLIRDRNLKVSIMRAPREDEPVLVGLG